MATAQSSPRRFTTSDTICWTALLLVAFLVAVGACAYSQSQPMAVPAGGIVFPLSDPPQPVPSASVARISGTAGARTKYYWVVSNTLMGQSVPAGPYTLQGAPTVYGSGAGQGAVVINWTAVPGASSYDVLRTNESVPPIGACNCAVATAVTGTTATDTLETRLSYTLSPINAGAAAINLANQVTGPGTNALNINGSPIAGGMTCTGTGLSQVCTMVGGLTNGSTNWILNAAGYGGADWVAKVNATAAALPQGGTVWIPRTLAGTATSGALNIPGNVALWFDAGQFKTASAVNITGSQIDVHGVYGATALQFTGATDGVVWNVTGYPNWVRISNITLQTLNPAGGAALRIDGSTTFVPTDFHMDHVNILGGILNTGGTGRWAYAIHHINLQYSDFVDVRVAGAYTVGMYTGGSEVNSYKNVFFYSNDATPPTRCIDSETATLGGITYPSSGTFDGGGCFGTFSGSAVYGAGLGVLQFNYFTTDVPGGTETDGAYIVANNQIMTFTAPQMAASVLVENGGILQSFGGQVGDITIANTAGWYYIAGTSYNSLTANNMPGCTAGNATWAGTITNSIGCGKMSIADVTNSAQMEFFYSGSLLAGLGSSSFNLFNGTTIQMGPNTGLDTFIVRQGSGHVQLGGPGGYGVGGNLESQTLTIGSSAGTQPIITAGSGAPSGSCVASSEYHRTDTSAVYLCNGGTWALQNPATTYRAGYSSSTASTQAITFSTPMSCTGNPIVNATGINGSVNVATSSISNNGFTVNTSGVTFNWTAFCAQ